MLTLSPDRLDVWLLVGADKLPPTLYEEYRQLIAADERAAADRFHFVRDRIRHVATRALLRTVLSRYLPVGARDWRFVSNAYGKPAVISAQLADARLTFNIAHTTTLIALAVGDCETVGIDVECERNLSDVLDLADRFFSGCEAHDIRTLHSEARRQRFLEYWTLKESYIKAHGRGLSIPLDDFSFTLGLDRIDFQAKPECDERPSRWRFWQGRVGGDHFLALCAPRSGPAAQTLRVTQVMPLRDERPGEIVLIRQSS